MFGVIIMEKFIKFDCASIQNLQYCKKILDKLYIEYWENNKYVQLMLENAEYELLLSLYDADVADDEIDKIHSAELDALNDNELAYLFFDCVYTC